MQRYRRSFAVNSTGWTKYDRQDYPEIDTSNPNDPQFVAAAKLLAEVQAEARKIIAAQPGVTDVRWELDRKWLASRSIDLPDKF